MINYNSKLKVMVIIMNKKTKKIFAWAMLIIMVASVIASILAYTLAA